VVTCGRMADGRTVTMRIMVDCDGGAPGPAYPASRCSRAEAAGWWPALSPSVLRAAAAAGVGGGGCGHGSLGDPTVPISRRDLRLHVITYVRPAVTSGDAWCAHEGGEVVVCHRIFLSDSGDSDDADERM
jgi:hypothetical protein